MSVVVGAKAASLGTKRTCRSCAARFYDLCKEPPVCPQCQAVFDVHAVPELPPLAPEELEDEAARRKARKKKKDGASGADRGRYDAGDDGAADPDADW